MLEWGPHKARSQLTFCAMRPTTDEEPGQGDRRVVERQATTQLTTLTSGYLDNRFVPTPRLLPAWQAGAEHAVLIHSRCRFYSVMPAFMPWNNSAQLPARAYFFSPRPSFLEPGH